MDNSVDILILSNGPGELATWVQPVVKELRQQLGDNRTQVRISIVLSPCTNASGQEVAIARRYPEVDRVQGADSFFRFLLMGQTLENWDWRSRGVVLFLGGDQFFPILIGKRLGYRTVIYAEWEARWQRWGDRYGVMKPDILSRVSSKYAHKFTVVGDLMAEAGSVQQQATALNFHKGTNNLAHRGTQAEERTEQLADNAPLIGLLPGSKPMKLTLGVPLTLAIAELIQQQRSDVQFVIPVAPTLDLPTLARYANPQHNPTIDRLGWGSGEVKYSTEPSELPYFKTSTGVKVFLWTEFPAYTLLTRCKLCLTTLGANTAELGALAVPMLVLIPTQQLDVMKAWDGLPGLLANLPGVGSGFATVINWFAARNPGLLSWPNIWANREIVPELVGHLEPAAIATQVLQYLDHPAQLEQMHQDLQAARGEPGAAKKLVQLVCDELDVYSDDCPSRRPNS
ncbi:MAG: lipid-A-disaccharide synthase [Leptolyngbyaceae cyanobacterium bins.349]|nr:lipid-A-disaccharide synthase [Leptolyngbyaceae cyanobacterium bins.349]